MFNFLIIILGMFFFIFFVLLIYKLKKKITLTSFLIKFILIFTIWSSIFLTDFAMCQNNKSPIFSTSFNSIFTIGDGGTVIYFGLGYKIYDFNTPFLKHQVIYPMFSWYNLVYDIEMKKSL